MGLSTSGDLPSVGAVLSGPHWPGRVRVVRIEPRGLVHQFHQEERVIYGPFER